MTNKEQFHCVGCGGTLTSMEAELVFLTGFYRVIHPLGLCKSCFIPFQESEQQRNSPSAAAPNLTALDDFEFNRSYTPDQLLVTHT
ncbi:hypothetical protein [Paenibacillus sp. BC26]|uniref:hypothetical protein n=1 Tax=Paenibacillus sp. BC26 TaxID=1881032 RepID=UPI0008EAA999|nr:hypothetical protein [Paenibacillus sp. BC26]SFT02778.1 hypothetical protein SAMN05428962_3812 [Paenibacillus sp. BC26]